MKRLCAVALLLFATLAKAQNYDVSLIPKDLLSHANSVVRNAEETVEVKDYDNVIVHVKEAITILNKNGDENARVALIHDKIQLIKYVKGAVYDSFGKQTGKFSERDFEDESSMNDFSLFEDTRLKHYRPAVTDYPYTIAYEYELRYKQSLCFDTWQPVENWEEAVQNSSFQFICKPDFKIRYKETAYNGTAVIGSTPNGLKTYTWKVENLNAIRAEPFSPYERTYFTNVKISPEKFKYEGLDGTFSNWQELGKWIYDKLLVNRDQLPPETIAYVQELTKNIQDPKLKAKKIYEYMQSKTRYVSIQVGIGGFQPFLAGDVDHWNYGDCKALVNYTKALLKAVNIDSYYCVVEAGDRKVGMIPDFASMNQGDHIILCIPFKNDTTWAECTNQKMPFGYLSAFTDDRLVLACTPEGGKLLHTPKYAYQDNLQNRKGEFTITETGELSGDMSTSFKGVQYENDGELADEPLKEQLKKVKSIYPINNMEVDQLNYKQLKDIQPIATENIKLHARDYASTDNGKLYFMLNPANRYTHPPRELRNRITDVCINRGYTDEDDIVFTLPKGYKLEKSPLNVLLSKPFGHFSATMEIKGDQLVYHRKMEVIDGTFSKDAYADVVSFYQAVADADEYTVVLTKSN